MAARRTASPAALRPLVVISNGDNGQPINYYATQDGQFAEGSTTDLSVIGNKNA
ncbi:hypothetical protein MJ575_17115 [Klebsiella pneumoniae]|nr:hypothetical protein MJ575_17115 [Klebsiella pneumoniae]